MKKMLSLYANLSLQTEGLAKSLGNSLLQARSRYTEIEPLRSRHKAEISVWPDIGIELRYDDP